MDAFATSTGINTAGPAFASSRVLHFSDFSADEKDAFIRFFCDNKIHFFKDVDGSYVTNIRLYDPSVVDLSASQKSKKRADDGAKAKRGGAAGGSGDDAFTRLVADLSSSSVAIDYSVYARFTSLVSPRDAVKPKARPLAWLMRNIEEIYDQRYAKDTADLRGEADGSGEDGGAGGASPFPQFVVEFFSKRYGLRSLIDQNCWDLLYNTHLLRKEHLEVETFARFLEEHYDADDLLFYLYVRSVIQKELNVTFRTRWNELGRGAAAAAAETGGATTATSGAPVPLFLTLRECQVVSRVVFGSESDPLYRTFMTMIDRHLQAPPVPSSAASAAGLSRRGSMKGADQRRIEVTQFLHLALVEYHETRPADDADLSAALGSSGGPGMVGGGGAASVLGGSGSVVSSPARNPSSSASGAGVDAASEALYREAEALYDERLRAASSSSSSQAPSSPAAQGPSSSSSSASSSASPSATSPSSASAAAVSTAAALLRRSPTFFDDLGNAMHRANEAYLDRMLSPASTLPREVQAQIRAEVQAQLEGKLDVILATVIRAAQTGSTTGSDGKDALVAHFARVMAAAAGEAPASAETSVDAFCEGVLRHGEVQDTVNPLVSLLVTYATSRLQDGTTGTAVPATFA